MHKYKTHVQYRGDKRTLKPVAEIVGDLLTRIFSESDGPILIAVGGPGGTGKSSFCKALNELLGDSTILTLDDYKRSRSTREARNIFGPHPEANEIALIETHLLKIKNGKSVDKPVYNSISGEADKTEHFSPGRFVIIDGEISTYRSFRELVDFSIFIDSNWKTQLATRVSRDVEERGYTQEKAITTFLQSNLREFSQYGSESKKWADVHLYCESDYRLTIESVAEELYHRFENLLEATFQPVDFNGLIVPVATPFTEDNAIDQKMFVEHLNFLAEHGVRRILVNGTTGEFFSLSIEERKLLLKLAREYFPGVVIFHVGCDNLVETEHLTEWAMEFGADAIMAIPPYYYAGAPEQGIVEYYRRLSDSCDLPLILYNFPRNSQIEFTPDMLKQIKHYGIKDSSANLPLVQTTPHYFIGSSKKILEAHRAGAYGFVSAPANFAPGVYVKLEEALKKNDPTVEDLQNSVTEFSVALSTVSDIAAIKYALSELIPGYPANVRLPLLPLTKSQQQDSSLRSILLRPENLTS